MSKSNLLIAVVVGAQNEISFRLIIIGYGVIFMLYVLAALSPIQ